jgi:hypothetical protein
MRRPSRAFSARPTRVIAVRLLAGAELLHGPLGVPDGRGIVAEEELGHRAPAGTLLHGVGYDLCPAGRLAGPACGLSRCRRYDHANANRTDCECHNELPHGTRFRLDKCFPTTRGGRGLDACSCRPRQAGGLVSCCHARGGSADSHPGSGCACRRCRIEARGAAATRRRARPLPGGSGSAQASRNTEAAPHAEGGRRPR